MFRFELGQEVKDRLTGFKGYITGRCEYLTGCIQYSINPKIKKGDTGYPQGTWMDEDRLEKGIGKFKLDVKVSGGPQQSPSKM